MASSKIWKRENKHVLKVYHSTGPLFSGLSNNITRFKIKYCRWKTIDRTYIFSCEKSMEAMLSDFISRLKYIFDARSKRQKWKQFFICQKAKSLLPESLSYSEYTTMFSSQFLGRWKPKSRWRRQSWDLSALWKYIYITAKHIYDPLTSYMT